MTINIIVMTIKTTVMTIRLQSGLLRLINIPVRYHIPCVLIGYATSSKKRGRARESMEKADENGLIFVLDYTQTKTHGNC